MFLSEIIIGVTLLSIGGISTFAYKNPKSYENFLAPVLFFLGTIGFVSYFSYMFGKDDLGPSPLMILVYLVFMLWHFALFHIHKFKD